MSLVGRYPYFVGVAALIGGTALWMQSAAASVADEHIRNELLHKRVMTCRDWAEAANHVISMGEPAAVRWLQETARRGEGAERRDQRIGHLCRIVFVAKPDKLLRQPCYGALLSFFDLMLPSKSWPEFPFVEQGSVWFLLGESYMLAGFPEPTENYIEYCRANGKFRTSAIKVPTHAEASMALKALLRSERWAALTRPYRQDGGSYRMTFGATVEELESQTKF
jgi:hypothetical protein